MEEHFCEMSVSSSDTCGKSARFLNPEYGKTLWRYAEWLCAECYDMVMVVSVGVEREIRERKTNGRSFLRS